MRELRRAETERPPRGGRAPGAGRPVMERSQGHSHKHRSGHPADTWVAAAAVLAALGAWIVLSGRVRLQRRDPGVDRPRCSSVPCCSAGPMRSPPRPLSSRSPASPAGPTGPPACSRWSLAAARPPRRVGRCHARRAREHHRPPARAAPVRRELRPNRTAPRLGTVSVDRRRRVRTLFAALTVATSRLSLHGSRSGSLWGVLFGPPQITLAWWDSSPPGKDARCATASSTPSPRSSRSSSA